MNKYYRLEVYNNGRLLFAKELPVQRKTARAKRCAKTRLLMWAYANYPKATVHRAFIVNGV